MNKKEELIQKINEFGNDQKTLMDIIHHVLFELRGSINEEGYQDQEYIIKGVEHIEQDLELIRNPEKDNWE